jgi:hypothetical protein
MSRTPSSAAQADVEAVCARRRDVYGWSAGLATATVSTHAYAKLLCVSGSIDFLLAGGRTVSRRGDRLVLLRHTSQRGRRTGRLRLRRGKLTGAPD